MSSLEWGRCSPEVYESGKDHLVTPGRLSVDGVYALMTSLRGSVAYYKMPIRIKDVHTLSPAERATINAFDRYTTSLDAGSAAVSFYTEPPELAADSDADIILPEDGLIQPRSHTVREMYLRHGLDDVDDALYSLMSSVEVPQETNVATTVPGIV